MPLPSPRQDEAITIPPDMMREASYSVVARYFPSNYPKQLIMQEIQDRARMTRYLRSLMFTSRRFSQALETFLGLVQAMLPQFRGTEFADLSQLISTRIDSIAEKIETFVATMKSQSSSSMTGGGGGFGSTMMTSLAAGGAGAAAISSVGQQGAQASVPPAGEIAAKDLPQEARAFLNTIAAPGLEGGSSYNIIVGGGHFNDYSKHPGIVGVRTAQGPSTAAGRYQFTKTTWNDMVRRHPDLTDFSPANQDKAAWYLAQEEYKTRTGGDLLQDLKSKDPQVIQDISRALSGRWSSFEGGVHQGSQARNFSKIYLNYLGQPVPEQASGDVPQMRQGGMVPENQPQQLALLHAGEVVGRPEDIMREARLADLVPIGKQKRDQILIVPVLMGQK